MTVAVCNRQPFSSGNIPSRWMGFVRAVEIFPPLFPRTAGSDSRIDLEHGIDLLIDDARRVRKFADILLVADVKNPRLLKLSTIEAAAMLRERVRVDVAPVLVVRDFNRSQFLSAVLTCLSRQLGHLMFAWGDDYAAGSGATNVRDFATLAQSIREATLLRKRAAAPTRFLAPVNVELLSSKGEVTRARERLRAGSEYLLAQPPTTDLQSLERHEALLRGAGLRDRVLLNVFPFKDFNDVRECEAYFGWNLPHSLHRIAEKGQKALFETEREVVTSIRSRGLPGIYLNTRGIPSLAERFLS